MKKSPGKKKTTLTLLPVMRPSLNMREIIKQMLLLEDHLFQTEKRCKDCIRKHFMVIEALAEECVTLCDPSKVLPESRKIASTMRAWHHAWEQRPDDPRVMEKIANKIRMLRKSLMKSHASLPADKLPSPEAAEMRAILSTR